MPLVSQRLPAAKSLAAFVQTIQNTTTTPNQPLYQLVKLGAVFDPGANTSWCEITHFQGKSSHAGSGGNQIQWRIDDELTFMLTSGIGPYETDSTAAQINMLTIQDILLPALHQHFQIPDASNPSIALQSVYSVLANQVDRSQPAKFPNGHVYLLWHVPVVVKLQYNAELVQP